MKNLYNQIEQNLKVGLNVVVKDLEDNNYCTIFNLKDSDGDYVRGSWCNSIKEAKKYIGSYYGELKEYWDAFDLEIVEVYRPEEKAFEVGDEVRISDKIKEIDDWDFYKDSFPEMKGKIGEVYNNILGRYYNVNGWRIGHEYLIPLIEDDEVEKDENGRDNFFRKLEEILDEQFPKYKCKERGNALVLFSMANLFLKSSLQEQRQSILEEIEKKIKELGIQTDKADTQIQNEDFNEFFSKEDAEKLIHDNLIIIKALEDIKQLLKIN